MDDADADQYRCHGDGKAQDQHQGGGAASPLYLPQHGKITPFLFSL